MILLPHRKPLPGAVAALVSCCALAVAGCGGGREEPSPAPARPPVVESPAPLAAGRPVPAGDPEALADLDRFLAGPIVERPCGAYQLRTDLAGPALRRSAALCATVAGALEGEVGARFGLVAPHPPRGTIVLFASRRRFREAGAAQGDLPAGYAAWSEARLGVVAIAAEGVGDDELARTLAHELAHLAERRLFGFPRPRWLAEGLADALSDTASASGFAPLTGFEGAEAARRRWLARRTADAEGAPGGIGPIERLVSLEGEQFDATTDRLDYELAALWVRFLLIDPELSPRFREWLAGQTVQQPSPAGLTATLATGWPALELRFADWISRSTGRLPGANRGGPGQGK